MAATQAQIQALIDNYDIRLIADNSNASSNPSKYFAMKPKDPSNSQNASILAPFLTDSDYTFGTLLADSRNPNQTFTVTGGPCSTVYCNVLSSAAPYIWS